MVVALIMFIGTYLELKGIEAVIVYIIAIILLFTGITGFSFVFAIFGVNTNQKNTIKKEN